MTKRRIPERLVKRSSMEEDPLEEFFQDEIRKTVFDQNEGLKEKLKNRQAQEINLEVLQELADTLTDEEIREIDRQVRRRYQKAKGKDKRSGFFILVLLFLGGWMAWLSGSPASGGAVFLFILAMLLWLRRLLNAFRTGIITRRVFKSEISGSWHLFYPRMYIRRREPGRFWKVFLSNLVVFGLAAYFLVAWPVETLLESNEKQAFIEKAEPPRSPPTIDFPVRLLKGDEGPAFTAVHYLPVSKSERSVSIVEYTLSGPKEDTAIPVTPPSIYPLNQIAVDPRGPRYYGITTHRVGEIDIETGAFHELETDPDLPELSWPSGIAFDSERRRLVVTGRSESFVFYPDSNRWNTIAGFDQANSISLYYSPEDDRFFALIQSLGTAEADTVIRMNPHGAVLSTIRLSHPIPLPNPSMPGGRLQLFKPSREIVILQSAYFRRDRSGRQDHFVEMNMFLVDPETGNVERVKRVQPPPALDPNDIAQDESGTDGE